jgi:hypothetical protein
VSSTSEAGQRPLLVDGSGCVEPACHGRRMTRTGTSKGMVDRSCGLDTCPPYTAVTTEYNQRLGLFARPIFDGGKASQVAVGRRDGQSFSFCDDSGAASTAGFAWMW